MLIDSQGDPTAQQGPRQNVRGKMGPQENARQPDQSGQAHEANRLPRIPGGQDDRGCEGRRCMPRGERRIRSSQSLSSSQHPHEPPGLGSLTQLPSLRETNGYTPGYLEAIPATEARPLSRQGTALGPEMFQGGPEARSSVPSKRLSVVRTNPPHPASPPAISLRRTIDRSRIESLRTTRARESMLPIGQFCHTRLGLGAQRGTPTFSSILPGGIYTRNGPVSVVAVL